MHLTAPLRTLTKHFISRPSPTALLSSTRPHSTIDDFSCLGWDGRPLGKGKTDQQWRVDQQQEKSETEDYKKYYEKHKPSPLSNVEFADTRKLITRATGRAGDDENKEILLVRDTVDDALRRAEEMWWAAKVRGDPDSPQARALARMLNSGKI